MHCRECFRCLARKQLVSGGVRDHLQIAFPWEVKIMEAEILEWLKRADFVIVISEETNKCAAVLAVANIKRSDFDKDGMRVENHYIAGLSGINVKDFIALVEELPGKTFVTGGNFNKK